MKKINYTIQGHFSNPELPVDMLINIEELLYYKQISSIGTQEDPLIFKASDLENIAMQIYKEYMSAKNRIKNKQTFSLETFPFLMQKKEFYLQQNKKLAQNYIFSRFIENDLHLNVFTLALFEEKKCKDYLNQLFREFYFEFRFMSYINKTLYFSAIHFDKKNRLHHEREALILDQPINNQNENSTYIEQVASTPTNDHEIDTNTFENQIVNENLYDALKKLTRKQQEILYYAYVEGLVDREIAGILNVSRQVISKTRKKALISLKNRMEEKL